ncbi:protein S40-1-like [Miscanthus floridulus]|uniref:protein S40-1-like n=1 Tax=Miscanthus floridulus TaxID=154761 RepID=UPI00345949E4
MPQAVHRLAMEEFQEADVLWPDVALAHHHDCHRHRPADSHGHSHQHLTGQQQPRAAVVHTPLQSPPVRIPSMPPPATGAARPTSREDWWTRSYYGDDDDSSEEVGIVLPHVLAARRRAEDQRRVMASSVCMGHGRTLKGRDLRAVRNAVLHMTGFLSSSGKY